MKISLKRVKEIIREELIREKLNFGKVMDKYNKRIVDNALALAKQHAIKDKHRGSKQTPKLIAIKTINRMKEYRNKTKGDLKNLFQKTISKLEKQYKRIKEGKLSEDYKNNEWEVYLKDEKGREKIVKKAKSKRAATILYNRIIKSDDYYEVGMRAIKEGKLTEGRRETIEIPLRQKTKVSKILKKLRLKPGKDWTTRFGGRTHFILDMEEKYFNKTLEQLIKNKIKVRG